MPQFNTFQYNRRLYNGGEPLAASYSTDTLAFYDTSGNAFSLSDGTTMVLTDLRFLGPSRELVGGSVPRGDGQFLTADYFREYVIEAEGIVKASTAALLDAQLDTIRKNLRHREGSLDYIDANGTVKRFSCTMDGYEDLFAGRERYHITVCPWKARFKCKTPFGKARSYTSVYLSVTSSPTTQSLVNAGTYKAQPVFLLIFNSASSVTALNVNNTTTGEQLDLTGMTVAANDVYVFDSELKTVTRNGTAVNYTGAFPSLNVGANLVTLTLNGTFNVDVTSKWKLTYL